MWRRRADCGLNRLANSDLGLLRRCGNRSHRTCCNRTRRNDEPLANPDVIAIIDVVCTHQIGHAHIVTARDAHQALAFFDNDRQAAGRSNPGSCRYGRRFDARHGSSYTRRWLNGRCVGGLRALLQDHAWGLGRLRRGQRREGLLRLGKPGQWCLSAWRLHGWKRLGRYPGLGSARNRTRCFV
jgi:hypothetical protein